MQNKFPFDLQRALAGDKLVTRDGREVEDFKVITGFSHDPNYPITARIGTSLITYTINGAYHPQLEDHSLDLFMLVDTDISLTLHLQDNFTAAVNEVERGIAELDEEETVLQEAHSLIFGDREADYGRATDNFRNIAAGWNVQLAKKLKEEITPEDVCLLMVWLKLARQSNRPKRDNLVDAAGYIGLVDKIRRGQ